MEKCILENKDITLTASDPWDFVTENGTGPFMAKILLEGRDSFLIKLYDSCSYRQEKCIFFVCRPRYTRDDIYSLFEHSEVVFNLTFLPDERVNTENPLDLSWWRGGLGLFATISLTS